MSTVTAATQCKCGHIGEDHRLDDADSPVDPDAKFRCVGHMTEGGVWVDSKCDCPDFDPQPVSLPYRDTKETT